MPDLHVSKPNDTEYASYFGRYVDLVPDGEILGTLAGQISATLSTLRGVSDADSLKRYAEGKWSIREVVGHMIDTERIFAYRALRIARNDQTNLPGFEHSHDGFPKRGDLFWSPADWAWTGGLWDALMPTLYHGQAIVGYRGRFDAERAFQILEKYSVRCSFG